MKKSAIVLSALFILSACASMQSDSGKGAATVDIVKPDIQIRQLSSVPTAATNAATSEMSASTGMIQVHLGMLSW